MSEHRQLSVMSPQLSVATTILPTITAPHPVDGVDPLIRARLQGWMQQLLQACNQVLGQLHEALALERARSLQLQAIACEAQADLARLQAELEASRAGELLARHQSLHDGLTQLPNRQHVRASLHQAIMAARAQRTALSVIYIDLDDFKLVNDVHGHGAGDELLAVVAARLRRAIRADDLVGRMGGDEFACVLTNMQAPLPLGRLACQVYDSVSAPIKLGDLTVSVRPSIGIATLRQGCGDTDALLHAADQAMYRAKREQTGYAFAAEHVDDPAGGISEAGPSAPGCCDPAGAWRR